MKFFRFFNWGNTLGMIEMSFTDFLTIRFLGYCLGLIITLMFCGIVTLIIPTLWLIFYFSSIHKHRIWLNTTAIICCIYFLLDYYFNWIVKITLVNFTNISFLNKVYYYNISLLLTHIILLLFGNRIYSKIVEKNSYKTANTLFLFFVLLLVFFGYRISNQIFSL